MEIQTNQDQLAQTIAAICGQLGQARGEVKATFSSDTTLDDGYQTRAQIRQFGSTVDEPPTLGGTDKGPRPVELVLAALGTCQEIAYANPHASAQAALDQHRPPLDEIGWGPCPHAGVPARAGRLANALGSAYLPYLRVIDFPTRRRRCANRAAVVISE